MTREDAVKALEVRLMSDDVIYVGDTSYPEALSMAIEALKAQEPHIVTIADYKNNPNVDKDGNLAVWRESRHFNGVAYHEDGWIVLNRDRVEGWFNSEVIRFWTSRPTDAQREATPWQTR